MSYHQIGRSCSPVVVEDQPDVLTAQLNILKDDDAKGTGGTNFVHFLSQSRKETRRQRIKKDKKQQD